MEKEVIDRFKMHDRMEVVSFLKSMWNENPKQCPFCGGSLDFHHKKAKKNNCDWKCTGCGERFDTMKILNELNEN